MIAADDSVDDDDESVVLGFGTPPPGVVAGSVDEAVVAIADDDDPAVTVRFGSATYGVAEGDDVLVKVRLSADPKRTVGGAADCARSRRRVERRLLRCARERGIHQRREGSVLCGDRR